MTQKNIQTDHPDPQQLLDLRFITNAQFRLQQQSASPENLTRVMQFYSNQLMDIGFSYSHEIQIEQCIGKLPEKPARMLVFLNSSQSAYAILTDLYHVKSWVYFTHYFALDHRAITTCQPGALELDAVNALSATASFVLQNTNSGTLKTQNLQTQWKKHQNFISTRHPTDKALLMDPYQHLDAEREAYRRYTDQLLDSVILRQSDTQLVGFTHTGAHSYHAAVNSTSAKRPNPKAEKLNTQRGKTSPVGLVNLRNAALVASAAVFGILAFTVATFTGSNNNTDMPSVVATPTDIPTTDETSVAIAPDTTLTTARENLVSSVSETSVDDELPIAPDELLNEKPEQFIIASEEDEMWRIAVENAEFYLMSNDGDPAPWIRTARKMAAGFTYDDPRLGRTYFLAAILERDPKVAEQRYNRALSIQTKTLGLYHTETAQTLEALAWVAEGARDDLEEAITHQRLALNVYRNIFGEEAEDTRAALWKLQYFEDRLEGRRPKSDDNRRLLPALARFAR